MAGILTALETYCVPRKNTTYEGYVSRMTTQEDRTIDVFVTGLRRRAEHCDFGALKNSLIRDQIVVGILAIPNYVSDYRERRIYNSRKQLSYAESRNNPRNNQKYSTRQLLKLVALTL